MKREDQYIELIDRYLRNKLSDEELAVFNDMLKNNHEFERTFFEMDQLVSGIRHSAMTSTVEEKLKRLESFLPEIKPADLKIRLGKNIFLILSEKIEEFATDLGLGLSLTMRQVKYAMAGVTVAISALTLVLFFQLRTPDPADLFADNFNPPIFDNFGKLRGSFNAIPDIPEKVIFHEAMESYNTQNYKLAFQIINTIPSDKFSAEMKLYQALINIRLENYGTAKAILTDLRNSQEAHYVNEAKWYLAVCLVKDEKYGEALSLLNDVIEYGNDHSGEAAKLLRKLK
jgi:hypothetical protein